MYKRQRVGSVRDRVGTGLGTVGKIRGTVVLLALLLFRLLLSRCCHSLAATVLVASCQIAHARDNSFLSVEDAGGAVGGPTAGGVGGVGGVISHAYTVLF